MCSSKQVDFVSAMKCRCRVIAVNLAVFLVGIAVLELTFGGWCNPRKLNRLNLMRATTILYDASAFYVAPNGPVVYRRDEFGLRGRYPSPDQIDILTIGGSTTDQRLITEGETWQDVLAQEFATRGRAVSVVNAGVDGQSTYGHIKDFDWWFPSIPNLRARYFLFYVGVNDLYVSPNTTKDDLVQVGSIRTLIKERSAFYYVYRTLYGIHEAAVAQINHRKVDFTRIRWTEAPVVSDHARLMRPRIDAYRTRLRILGQRVRASGGTAICVTQVQRKYKKRDDRIIGDEAPTSCDGVQINGVDSYYMMQLLNQATMEECGSMGGLPVDLANELVFEDDDFYDFEHTTPRGAAKIGHYLYQRLAPALKIEGATVLPPQHAPARRYSGCLSSDGRSAPERSPCSAQKDGNSITVPRRRGWKSRG